MPSSGIADCDGQLDYMCRIVNRDINVYNSYMASRLELVHVGPLVSGLQTPLVPVSLLDLFV